MNSTEVLEMIRQALYTMLIGVLGVFSVLTVFYLTLKLMMAKAPDPSGIKREDDGQ
jgi:hypothetical protein